MTRAMIFAILAFSLLMIANLAVFGFLSFRDLSAKMVTEHLMEELNEARRFVGQHAQEEGAHWDRNRDFSFTNRIAPKLRRYAYFQAVLVLDRNGQVVYRAPIHAVYTFQTTTGQRQEPHSSLRRIPVQDEEEAATGSRLALEYDADDIRKEVESLRGDLNRKLSIALLVSVLLLVAGLAYVIWAYRRNELLQERARRADRLAYVGTLASGLAHEIRNPLNSMNMNVQLILEELEDLNLNPSLEIRELLEGTRREVGRLEQMVSSFLAYARPTRLVVQSRQLNDTIRETLQFLGPEIEERGVVLRTVLDSQLPQVSVDENQIRQALINVIQNALQVLQPGKVLEIRTRKAGGDKVLIAVRDEGPGISAEELKHIFKVFYSTKLGGSGLGLPIAQRIAELHDGGLKVESEIGKGTTVTFILPMDPSP